MAIFSLALLGQAERPHKCRSGSARLATSSAGIVLQLGKAKSTVDDLASTLQSVSDIQTVQDGIAGAQGAVGVIAKALLSGQTAPADARDQVAGNLTSATTTLSTITSTDADATDTLAKARQQLNSAVSFGQGVVANCK
ncbi:hypothetical protein EVG20_g7610 [Dentipellis fragilis]|uniref:Uncharacterized protein n=1 Tax=Dentipellis fragilis TaxID=205917 RepID=A0A4Y9YC76_9AGAM|nr:hypothetical protein EVG20_g7610 [Dentipellis fragilis]